MSTEGHHCTIGNTRVPDAVYQVSRPSAFRFQRKGFLNVFTIYVRMAAILVMWPGSLQPAFVPPSQGGSTWNLASIGLVVIEEKVLNYWSERFGPRSMNDLVLIKLHVRIYLTAFANFYIIYYKSFWKIHCFTFFQYKSKGTTFDFIVK